MLIEIVLVASLLAADTPPPPPAPPAAAASPSAPLPGKKKVVILVYPDVELMDVAAPFEVFSAASELHGFGLFEVRLAAESAAPLLARNGFALTPDCTFETCPEPDLFVVPGGAGVFPAMANPAVVAYVKRASAAADKVFSVCIGAFLLGKAGLLGELKATTHQLGLGYLSQLSPSCQVLNGPRFVDNGKILTSAGMMAGVDLSLHVLAQLEGKEVAVQTAKYMEYNWSPSP